MGVSVKDTPAEIRMATLRVMADGLLRMKANLAAELRDSDAVRASGARNG